jgi:tRNA threonylcarbamoyladenosine biosynthesis protein TsaE
LEIDIHSEKEIAKVARAIIDFSEGESIWLLYGDLGAGKTTLIAAVCKEFEVEDVVNSPSFAIIHEYANSAGRYFYHFDFYRIQDEEEASRLGLEEYFYSGDTCFVEWPSKIPSLLPEHYLEIRMEITNHHSRKIRVEKYG